MPIPHRLTITGSGFDVNEFFYGCNADTTDGPPGSGSRGLAPNEDATSYNFNRAAYALAENDEYLEDIICVDQKAFSEIGVLTGHSGNTIVIDPSGGAAGDINYTGSLYLGESGWGPGTQETRDTLFQLLDADHNEVLVDGVEVKVSGVTGNAIGDEFVTTATTVQLDATLPSGNYRLRYAAGATYETLPAYAMIQADIRGSHEAPGESARQSVYVLDAASAKPADFTGASALEDALTALSGGNITLFLRPGTYTMTGSLNISDSNVTIVGDSENFVSGGAAIDFTGGAYDLTVSGDSVAIQDCVLGFTNGNGATWTGRAGRMGGIFSSGYLNLQGDYWFGEDVYVQITTASSTVVGLTLSGCEHVNLVNGQFITIDGAALALSGTISATLDECTFTSDQECVTSSSVAGAFKARNCTFENEASNTIYNDIVFADFTMAGTAGQLDRGYLENCRFVIRRCQRSAGSANYITSNGFDAKNIYLVIDQGIYHRDGALVQLTNGTWDELELALDASSAATVTSADDGMIKIGWRGAVRHVTVAGSAIAGTWDMPLFYLEGGSSTGMAELEGVKFGTLGTDWACTTHPMVAALNSFCKFSDMEWIQVDINGAVTNWSLVGLNDQTKSHEQMYVDDMRISLLNTDDTFHSHIRFHTNGRDIRVRNCRIISEAIDGALVASIYLEGNTQLTLGAFTTGLIECEISGNTISWEGSTLGGSGSNFQPNEAPIWLDDFVYMSRIHGNNVAAYLANTPSGGATGDTVLIFAFESQAGQLGTVEGGANMCNDNIVRNFNGSSTVDPDVASRDGLNAAGFADASNVLFRDV